MENWKQKDDYGTDYRYFMCFIFYFPPFSVKMKKNLREDSTKSKFYITFDLHWDSLTSCKDLLSEIISLARRLNWLILNFSLFSSSLS